MSLDQAQAWRLFDTLVRDGVAISQRLARLSRLDPARSAIAARYGAGAHGGDRGAGCAIEPRFATLAEQFIRIAGRSKVKGNMQFFLRRMLAAEIVS